MAALTAGVVRLETAVTGAATARGHRLFERRVASSGVSDAAGEGIAHGPESVATLAEAKRVNSLEFVTAENRHRGMVRAKWTAGLRRFRRTFGNLAAKVGEDGVGVSLPVSPCGTGPCLSKPLIIGTGHNMRIGGHESEAQEPAGIGV